MIIGKLKQLLDKILSFNIGNLFKAEINNKVADTIKDNKLVEYNKTENNNNVIQQQFNIAIINEMNVDESIRKALILGNDNAKAVGIDVNKLLKENEIPEEKVQEKLSNPEFLSTIAKANEIAYTTNDVEKRKILADLIYNKFNTEDDENSIILSQAIMMMKNLTKSHLKIIAFLYLFQSNYVKNNTNSKNFIEFYNKYIANLIDFPFNKLTELGITIISNGIAVPLSLSWSIRGYLPNGFYDVFTGKLHDIDISIKSKISHLDSVWTKLATSSSKLTPVGKCIGKIYLHDISGLDVIDSGEELKDNRKVLVVGN